MRLTESSQWNICKFIYKQWRSQNAEKVKHIQGRLLKQAVILTNCVLFKLGTSRKRKNLLQEGANSFL